MSWDPEFCESTRCRRNASLKKTAPYLVTISSKSTAFLEGLSRIQFLTSKISHICQEICDIKSRRRPQTNIAIQNYTNTGLVEEQTNRSYTREPDSSNFAKEDSDGVDSLGETYSFHSKLHHREPNNPDTPSHHAPTPPSPNPAPSESSLEPPGDLSPSPASKIVTETPSLLAKEEKKACNAALSSLVHTSPSGPCTAWNVLLLTWNGLGEVGRGVGDDGGLAVSNGREGWRTGSGWPSSNARRRDGDGN